MDEPADLPLTAGRLRPWRLDDAAALVRHANNRNVSRNLRDAFPFPYTEDDARKYLERQAGRTPVLNFAIEIDGEAVGGIGLLMQDDVLRRTAEIGYWIGESHWGRGIMTDAVNALTAYGFANFDIDRIEAGVFERNVASARVLAKAGYTLEGRHRRRIVKDGEVMDDLVYAILRA